MLNLDDSKPIKDLSGGNQRKLAVAISFLSNAHIILLDEPTSSLDPISRNQVHQLINKYKGQKTYMLCTHLLAEAEQLCDEISIMVKGCIFVIGTPQYLSQRFGTEWRVECTYIFPSYSNVVDKYFEQHFPGSSKILGRENSGIYSIPVDRVSLPDLFDALDILKNRNDSISYFTFSCSTLEKVFLEIVQMASKENVQIDGPPTTMTQL